MNEPKVETDSSSNRLKRFTFTGRISNLDLQGDQRTESFLKDIEDGTFQVVFLMNAQSPSEVSKQLAPCDDDNQEIAPNNELDFDCDAIEIHVDSSRKMSESDPIVENASLLQADVTKMLRDELDAKEQACAELERKFKACYTKYKRIREDLKAAIEEVNSSHSRMVQLNESLRDYQLNTRDFESRLRKDLYRMIFGNSVFESQTLEILIDQIVDSAYRDCNIQAIVLVARLMVLQSCDGESIPNVLKEIGEAFYRWRPRRSADPALDESSFARFIAEKAEVIGSRNSIDLVHTGERYDSSRHFSNNRGAEIASVHGWVVLRENGKPVTKALVRLQ